MNRSPQQRFWKGLGRGRLCYSSSSYSVTERAMEDVKNQALFLGADPLWGDPWACHLPQLNLSPLVPTFLFNVLSSVSWFDPFFPGRRKLSRNSHSTPGLSALPGLLHLSLLLTTSPPLCPAHPSHDTIRPHTTAHRGIFLLPGACILGWRSELAPLLGLGHKSSCKTQHNIRSLGNGRGQVPGSLLHREAIVKICSSAQHGMVSQCYPKVLSPRQCAERMWGRGRSRAHLTEKEQQQHRPLQPSWCGWRIHSILGQRNGIFSGLNLQGGDPKPWTKFIE